MGGKSSSSSATSTSTTTQVADNRAVVDNGGVNVGQGATANITQSDSGAINAALAIALDAGETNRNAVVGQTLLATRAIEGGGTAIGKAFDFSAAAGASALGAQKDALTVVKQAYEGATDAASGNRILAFTGITVAALLALRMVWK
jgi:hypothetical protein